MTQLKEALIPSDEESIMATFSQDISDDKYAPTVNFLEKAYDILNKEFFENKLPKRQYLVFNVTSRPRSSFIGTASYRYNRHLETVTTVGIFLNSAKLLTRHQWLEVVLHEMIHVLDYETNPQHFTGWQRHSYDSHGSWFMETGARFKDRGFNVERYCSADIGVNTDDPRVKRQTTGSVLMVLEGYVPKERPDTQAICKISRNKMEFYGDLIARRIDHGLTKGCTGLTFYETQNPNLVKLSELRMRDWSSGLRFYYFTDDFKEKYGPLTKIAQTEFMKPKYTLGESDKVEAGIEDQITNVLGVRKLKDDEYVVAIA